MLVHNRHCSHVAGIPPGADAHVDPELVARYPWALIPIGGEPLGDPEMSAREAREAIRKLEDPEAVLAFVDDPRKSVVEAAEARLKALGVEV